MGTRETDFGPFERTDKGWFPSRLAQLWLQKLGGETLESYYPRNGGKNTFTTEVTAYILGV